MTRLEHEVRGQWAYVSRGLDTDLSARVEKSSTGQVIVLGRDGRYVFREVDPPVNRQMLCKFVARELLEMLRDYQDPNIKPPVRPRPR